MARQLPVADICGTQFYVDVLQEELRQVDNQANRISFNFLRQDGDGYFFYYDPEHKCARTHREVQTGNFIICLATLPALMELDPEGLALKYDIPLEALYPENKQVPQRVKATLTPVLFKK